MKAIWASGFENEVNCTLGFSLKLPNTKKIKLRLAVSNTCRVFVNESFVWYGPQRTAHGFAAAQQLDLEKYLVEDENFITVEVASYNIENFYTLKEVPFFSAEIIVDGVIFAQSDDFKVYWLNDRISKVQRYSPQRPFTEAYIAYNRSLLYLGRSEYPQIDIITVDGKKIVDVIAPKCDFKKFLNADVIETGDVTYRKSINPLNNRIFENINNEAKGFLREEWEAKLSDEALSFKYFADTNIVSDYISENRYALMNFGRNATGFTEFEIEVIEPSEIYFLFDELIWDEVYEQPEYKGILQPENAKPLVLCRTKTACNTIKWNLDVGCYNLMSFEPYTMQYGKIVVSKGRIILKKSGIRLFETSAVDNISFNSDDEQLNKIFIAASNTLAQNAVDILMDCPSRERAGWMCDSYFMAKAEKLLTGKNVAEKNLLMSYSMMPKLETIPDKMLPMCYPADIEGRNIPNWAMWYVMELEDYYCRSNDGEMITKSRDKVYGLVDYFKQFENEIGLLENLEGWVFVEWSMANKFVTQVNIPTNILYCAMLKAISRLYGDIELSLKSDKLKDTIIEESFDGEYFCDQLVRENGRLIRSQNYTETCQYYAFFFDIADKQSFRSLYNTLFKNIDLKGVVSDSKLYPANAFVGKYLCMLYLLKVGKAADILEKIKDYLLPMAERTQTLWELDQSTASCCHGFAAVASNIIVGATTGFLYVDENNKIIVFNNNFCKEGSFKVSIPINDGMLEIDCENGNRDFKLSKDCKYTVVFE